MTNPNRPLVSVCIPSYNCADFVGEAIESVLNQTYTNWELIVTDDASTDNSAEILRQYQERMPERMAFKVAEKNLGPSGNSNFMMSLAKGDYIALLASDDRMGPERLEKQIDFLEKNREVGAVFSEVNIIDNSGNYLEQDSVFSVPIHDIRKQLLNGNFINAPSGTLRTSVVDRVGGFNPELLILQDYEYWLRILDEDEIVRLPEKLTDYRVHGNNLSIKPAGELASAAYYENAIVCIDTVLRWADKFQFADTKLENYLFLARHARRVDQMYLGSFKLAVPAVYSLATRALLIDPECVEALELIREVYSSVGDTSRAMGGKSLTIKDWEQERHSRGTEGSSIVSFDPLVRFKNARELVGGRLDKLADTIVKNSSQYLSGGEDVNRLYLRVAAMLLNEAKAGLKESFDQWDRSVQYRHDLEDGQMITRKVLEKPYFHDQAWELLAQYKEFEATCHYQSWIKRHALQEIDGQLFAERMVLKWKANPVFHLAMVLFPGEEALLADTLDSLGQQMYQNWCLTILSDDPVPDSLWDELETLNWIQIDENSDPYVLLNQTLSESTADWFIYIDPGVCLQPQALVQIGDYINIKPDWKLVYCDEDLIDGDGLRTEPKFKPDFNLDYLRSKSYIGSFCAIEKSAFNKILGFKPYVSAENYDLTLRVFDQLGEGCIGHISEVLVNAPANSPRVENPELVRAALKEHLERNKQPASIESGFMEGTNRVVYKHENTPKVSIVIPNKDKLEYLQPCVESLLEKTDYPDFELVIVDNDSQDPDTLAFYKKLKSTPGVELKLVDFPHAFNFSAMCNLGLDSSAGDYIVFLNNDTKIIQGEWLERMMLHAQRDDVGVVGARLVYPETGRIQHAGVVLGLFGIADHPFLNSELKEGSYMDRAHVDQNYSAVTAACMLVKRSVYDLVSRMDEINFAVSFNDIDLCLKVSEAGYRVVWTPYATLIHHGSVSQNSKTSDLDYVAKASKRFRREQDNMTYKWGEKLSGDPAFNPNLSLSRYDFKAEVNIPRNWDVNFHDRVRVLGIPLQGGSGDYRVVQPFQALSQTGLVQCEYYHLGDSVSRKPNTAEMLRLQPDVIVVQAAIDNVQMALLEDLEKFLPDTFRIFTIDDLITEVPEKSSSYRQSKKHFSDARSRLRKALSYCQRLIVSTQPLADYCADLIDEIHVLPNRLPGEKWLGLSSLRNQGTKPRVGWVGAQQHQGDLELIYDVVKATADEFDWIFMGMSPDEIKPYIRESHSFVSMDEYPEKMASLNLDIAIAPLEINSFNESKSNLRLLEYGVMGWPVVCTDIIPYQTNDAPVVRVQNNTQDWIDALRSYSSNPELRVAAGNALREWVLQHYIQEDHLDSLYEAFTTDASGEFRESSMVSSELMLAE